MTNPVKTKSMKHWALLLGFVFLLVTLILIWFIDYEFLKKSNLDKDYVFRSIVSLVAIFFSLLIVRRAVFFLARRLNKRIFKQFHAKSETGTHRETETQLYAEKYTSNRKHAVLMLHGFGGSTREFSYLCSAFNESEIYYITPGMLGFGLDSTELLEKVRYQDWFRHVLIYYDFLDSLFEKVSVVGFSMGAMFAMYVAEHRKPHSLILAAPALFVTDGYLNLKKAALSRCIYSIVSWTIPYMPKPISKGHSSVVDVMDESASENMFLYIALPVSSLRQLLLAQDHVVKSLNNVSYNNLLFLYGKHDAIVNNEILVEHLRLKDMDFECHCFENTAHYVYEDYDKKEAIHLTVEFIKKHSD